MFEAFWRWWNCCSISEQKTTKEVFVKICWQLKTSTRTWKCTCCTMRVSYLYSSDLPFKNFCKLGKKAATNRKADRTAKKDKFNARYFGYTGLTSSGATETTREKETTNKRSEKETGFGYDQALFGKLVNSRKPISVSLPLCRFQVVIFMLSS